MSEGNQIMILGASVFCLARYLDFCSWYGSWASIRIDGLQVLYPTQNTHNKIMHPSSNALACASTVHCPALLLVCVHGFFWNKAPMTLNNQLTTTVRWHPYLLTYNDVKSQHLPPFCHVLFTVKFSLPCCLERIIEVCLSKNSYYLCSLKNCTY